MGKQKQECR